jgi:hypothetical protein
MTNKSYHNPHSDHERQLAQTVAREAIEILYGPKQRSNRRAGCLIVTIVATLVAAVVIAGWLL